jgi:hypothetical protein
MQETDDSQPKQDEEQAFKNLECADGEQPSIVAMPGSPIPGSPISSPAMLHL